MHFAGAISSDKAKYNYSNLLGLRHSGISYFVLYYFYHRDLPMVCWRIESQDLFWMGQSIYVFGRNPSHQRAFDWGALRSQWISRCVMGWTMIGLQCLKPPTTVNSTGRQLSSKHAFANVTELYTITKPRAETIAANRRWSIGGFF